MSVYVKNVQMLSLAIAGMIPPQQSDINPEANTHYTLVVVKTDGDWRIKLLQNTLA